jgi:hypothetical protein
MGESTVVEWLNENQQRAYPLTANSTRWVSMGTVTIDIYPLILDARFAYSTTLPTDIKLESIEKTGTVLVFTITGVPTFAIDTATEQFPCYMRNANWDLLVIGDTATDVVANLTDGQILSLTSVYFEPTVAVELTGAALGVSSINFKSSTFGADDNIVNSGDVTLVEGYQTDIQFGDQVVKIAIGRNEGIPLGCENFFTDDLAYDCDSVISSINGASPRQTGGTITLVAGDHVKIYEDPEKNRIYIGLDFTAADICSTTMTPPRQ